MKARVIGLCVGSLLMLGFAGCGKPVPFVSTDGNFQADFPGKPQLDLRTTGNLSVVTYQYQDSDTTSWTVSYSDFPADSLENKSVVPMFDGAVNSMAKIPSAPWYHFLEEPVWVQEHPGRDVEFQARSKTNPEEGAGRCRMFLAGRRFYQVIVVGPKSKVDPGRVKAFLDSMKLLHPVLDIARPPPSANPTPQLTADSAAGKASIQEFRWLDNATDIIGIKGDPNQVYGIKESTPKPDGINEQHFLARVDFPLDTTIFSITIKVSDQVGWTTISSNIHLPIAVCVDGKTLADSHVHAVAKLSGQTDMDLYVHGPGKFRPDTQIQIEMQISVNGQKSMISAKTKTP